MYIRINKFGRKLIIRLYYELIQFKYILLRLIFNKKYLITKIKNINLINETLDKNADILFFIKKKETLQITGKLEDLLVKHCVNFKSPKIQFIVINNELNYFQPNAKILNNCSYNLIISDPKAIFFINKIENYGYPKIIISNLQEKKYEIKNTEIVLELTDTDFIYYSLSMSANRNVSSKIYVPAIFPTSLMDHEITKSDYDVYIILNKKEINISKFISNFTKYNIKQILIKANFYKYFEVEINTLRPEKLIDFFYKQGLKIEIL